MKNITVQYKDIQVFRLTVTPDRVTIKAPLATQPSLMEKYREFLLSVANQEPMLNCTKSFRGCLSLDSIDNLSIKMFSDSEKEIYEFVQ